MERNEIFIDIETVPDQRPGALDEFKASVTAPAQYKKADSIAAWLSENRDSEGEAAWLKTSFDGGAGQIVCIGFARNDEPAHVYAVESLSREAERQLLEDFMCLVLDCGAGTKVVGHNVIGFDLPFLWKRCMVHRIRPPFFFPRAPKPWSDQVADTMLMWDPTQRAGGSMDKICRALGIPGKDGMTGADVWPAVRDGRLAEVAAYCRADVQRTREMYRRMTFSDAEVAA